MLNVIRIVVLFPSDRVDGGWVTPPHPESPNAARKGSPTCEGLILAGLTASKGLVMSNSRMRVLGPRKPGYTVPDFPLPNPSAEELAVFAELYSHPVAVTWTHRTREVALLARVMVEVEAGHASPPKLTVMLRMKHDLLLTPSAQASAMIQVSETEDIPEYAESAEEIFERFAR